MSSEHAEHELHEEIGGPQGLDSLVPHAIGQFGKAIGRLNRNRLAGDARLERVGISKDPAKDVQVGGCRQPGQVEDVFLLGGAGEVRVDLEAVHVADDHQRRVFQGLAVQLKLAVCLLEVFVLAFVLPAEVVAIIQTRDPLPDKRKRVAFYGSKRPILTRGEQFHRMEITGKGADHVQAAGWESWWPTSTRFPPAGPDYRRLENEKTIYRETARRRRPQTARLKGTSVLSSSSRPMLTYSVQGP